MKLPARSSAEPLVSVAVHPSLAVGTLAFSTVLSILLQGFEYPWGNNTFHVPIVLGFAESASGPLNPFHATLKNFVSALWPLLATFVTEDTIYPVFLIIHFAARFAMLAVLFFIVKELVPGRPTSVLAYVAVVPLLGVMFTTSPLGHNELLVNFLTHSQLAVVFVLASWLFALRGRWILCAAALGVGFNLNAFVMLWGAVLAAAAMAWALRSAPVKRRLRVAMAMSLAFLVPAAPTAIWILDVLAHSPAPIPAYDFRTFLMEYFPDHTFFHTHLRESGMMVLLTLAAVVALGRLKPDLTPARRAVMAALFVGLLGILAFGLVLPYVTGSRLLLNLYPLRMDGYLIYLLLLALIGLATVEDRDRSGLDTWSPYPLVGLLSLMYGNLALLLMSVALDRRRVDPLADRVPRAVAVVLLGVAAYAVISGCGATRFLLPVADARLALLAVSTLIGFLLRRERGGALIATLAAATGALGVLTEQTGTGAGVALGIVYAIAAGVLWWGSFEAKGQKALAVIASAASSAGILQAAPDKLSGALLMASLAAGPLGYVLSRWTATEGLERLRGPAVAAALILVMTPLPLLQTIESRSLSRLVTERIDAWLEVQRWARRNTEAGSEFLTPLRPSGFSVLSRRSSWVDWQSGAAAMWSPDFYWTWWPRVKDVSALKKVGDWLDYAREHHLDYVVLDLQTLDRSALEALRPRYENRYFAVVAVPWSS